MPTIVEEFGAAADPDLALTQFLRLTEACSARDRLGLIADAGFRGRVIDILGTSEALGDHLIRVPDDLVVLANADALAEAPSARGVRRDLLTAVGADAELLEPVAAIVIEATDALRLAYRRQLLGIAARDLSGLAPMEAIATWLSDLADATLEAALAIARTEVGESAFTCRLAIIGMGKCGGRELNYISDVDVIFVAEAAEGCEEADALQCGDSAG